MSKFICLCGQTFKKKKECNEHAKIFEKLAEHEGFASHGIFKQHWKTRFLMWILRHNWELTFRLIGVLLIYFIALNHFKISMGWLESIGMGIGLGLAIRKG